LDWSKHDPGSGRVGVEKKNYIPTGNDARQLGRQLTNLQQLNSIAGRNPTHRVTRDAVVPAKRISDRDTNNHGLAAARLIE
jgi:hypothetical protein